MKNAISPLESTYNLELDKVIERIKKSGAKKVCLQLPDGMKPYGIIVEEAITQETGAKVFFWLGSNFGACDLPQGIEKLGIDLLVSWGHNFFHKKEGW